MAGLGSSWGNRKREREVEGGDCVWECGHSTCRLLLGQAKVGCVCEIEPAYVNEREAEFMRTCEQDQDPVCLCLFSSLQLAI